MPDNDKWLGAGLFVLGLLLVMGGIALEARGALEPPFAIAIAMLGFVSFGLATAAYIRWRTGTVTPQRVGAAVGVFVGTGVLTLGFLYLDGTVRLATMGVGVVLVGVAFYWNRRLVDEKDVVTRDERVDLLRYKASYRAHQTLILALLIWFWIRQLSSAQLPVDLVIVWLPIGSIFVRIGFYRYYTTHQ